MATNSLFEGKKMKTMIKISFLGTGSNGGTPQLDCRCTNCTRGPIKLRSSVLLQTNKHKIIFDCGPDFKKQLEKLNFRLQDISAVCITHLHWDHCLGLMELSAGKKLKVPIIVPDKIREGLLRNELFSFLFRAGFAKFKSGLKGISLAFIRVEHDPKFDTFAIKLTIHRKNILFCPDIAIISKDLLNEIKSANLVIFDGTFLLENKYHHISMEESAPILARLVKNVVFTHINHSENSKRMTCFLKKFGFILAFDGLRLKI